MLADAIAGLLGMSPPAIANINPAWRDPVMDLAWQSPLGLLGGLFVLRMALAPYLDVPGINNQGTNPS